MMTKNEYNAFYGYSESLCSQVADDSAHSRSQVTEEWRGFGSHPGRSFFLKIIFLSSHGCLFFYACNCREHNRSQYNIPWFILDGYSQINILLFNMETCVKFLIAWF